MKMAANERRARRHDRVRRKVIGTAERPRLCVFRSSKHIYAVFVDDGPTPGRVLTAVSSRSPEFRAAGAKGAGYSVASAAAVGALAARKAGERGITTVVFDRGGYRYTGRVKALADAARKGGLNL